MHNSSLQPTSVAASTTHKSVWQRLTSLIAVLAVTFTGLVAFDWPSAVAETPSPADWKCLVALEFSASENEYQQFRLHQRDCVAGTGYEKGEAKDDWNFNLQGCQLGWKIEGKYKDSGGNCVSYVAFRLAKDGVSRGIVTGDAANWNQEVINSTATTARDEKAAYMDLSPAVGAVAQWVGETHVAYIDWVSYDAAGHPQQYGISETSCSQGYSQRRTLSASDVGAGTWEGPDNIIHFTESNASLFWNFPLNAKKPSSVADGAFINVGGTYDKTNEILVGGQTYVVAGGAPLPVAKWSAVRAAPAHSQVKIIADTEFQELLASGSLSHYPANGTYVEGQSGAYVFAGGAALRILSWPGIDSKACKNFCKPLIQIDTEAVARAGGEGVWGHVRRYPADGTLIVVGGEEGGAPGGAPRSDLFGGGFVFAGGAPLALSTWDLYSNGVDGLWNNRSLVTKVGANVIRDASENPTPGNVRRFPADGTKIVVDGQQGSDLLGWGFVFAGGAPLALNTWDLYFEPTTLPWNNPALVTKVGANVIQNAQATPTARGDGNVRRYPTDGTLILVANDQPGEKLSGGGYVFAGGAPLILATWETVGVNGDPGPGGWDDPTKVTKVGSNIITNAKITQPPQGDGNVLRYPKDDTYLKVKGINVVYRVQGGVATPTLVQSESRWITLDNKAIGSVSTPALSGNVTVGSILTASAVTPMQHIQAEKDRPPSAKVTYQWLRNGNPISQATSKTYTLVPADSGQDISVKVTASALGYTDGVATSTPKKIASATGAVTKPTINGTATVGSKLTVGTVTTTPATATVTYQWLRGTAAITGATGNSYTLTAADNGNSVSVRVTSKASGYTDATQTSDPKTVYVTLGTGGITKPTINGTATVGSKLTVGTVTTTPATATVTYQWLRGTAAITGATGNTYTLAADDNGKDITVRVTSKASGYTDATQTSDPKKISAGTSSVAIPSISGTTTVNQTLTGSVATRTPSNATVTWQWLRNGTAISGATSNTYKLLPADSGQKISVKATVTASGYTSSNATSAQTPAISPAASSVKAPTISGNLGVGQELTASIATPTPSNATVAWQWFRDGTAISGATAQKYRLVAGDNGKKITARATVSAPGYNSSSATSASSASVCSGSACAVTLYRLCNTLRNTHYYTPDATDKKNALATWEHFLEEPSPGKVMPWTTTTDSNKNVAVVYRFYNATTSGHFYTINEDEKNAISANQKQYTYEGPRFVAYKTQVSGTVPLWRFYNNSTGAHFFTSNESEKKGLLDNKTFVYEGVAFYIYPA